MWPGLWDALRALVYKDLISEWRSREVILPALAFSIMAVVIFGFAFGPDDAELRRIAPGALWVIFTFVAVLVLNGSFSMERGDGGLEGVLMSPVDRSLIYFGKVIGNLIFMFMIELAVLLFACQSLLSPVSYRSFLGLLPVVVLGTVGMVSVGTLLAAISAGSKVKEIMLPVLLLPLVIPVIIASVGSTGAVLDGEGMAGASRWIRLLVPFDVIYLSVSSLVFEHVIEG